MNNSLQDLSADDIALLPDEVRQAITAPAVGRLENLEALSMLIATKRDEAVKARKESGIEETWLRFEEAYLGIDDANRAEFSNARWAKPMAMEGSLLKVTDRPDAAKATAFVRLTSRYVDAGAAKVCEIALPIDGKPFTLHPTPVPDMEWATDDDRPAEQVTGQPMPGHDGEPVKVSDLAAHVIGVAEKKAEKSAARIYDWMVEYKHNAEMRKVIFDSSRIGTGVLHGPIPEIRRSVKASKKGGALVVEVVNQTKPAARWLDPWCFYPAPGCGEDIHQGDFAFLVDPMLAGGLRDLAEQRGSDFIPEAIKAVIQEGPNKAHSDGANPAKEPHKLQFQVWHFFGSIPRKAFEAANPRQAKEELADEVDMDRVHAIVTMVNDTVIRAVLSPAESGRLPFHVCNWRRRAGHWAGVGVGEQVDSPQRIVNSATRAMLNNAGKSGGSQVVVDEAGVRPADNSWQITPDKLWYLNRESGIQDVRAAFAAFNWPNMTPQLMAIVEYGFKLAEEHSSIPLITQGQSGKTTPDTFGGQQLQDNNANQLLRDVGFGINDTITSPLVDQLYEWLLLDPEIPEDEKGDYKVDTSGALALIEKALQDQTIVAIGSMIQNPAFKIDPAKWFEAYARSKRLSPAEFQYSDAEWEKVSQQPPPKAPAVEAAEIRAQAQVATAKSRDQLTIEKIKADTDRDTVYNQSLAARDAATANLRMEELRLRVRLAELDYASKHEISLQEAKTRLADTTMKLQVQRELAGQDGNGPQVVAPEVEPAGRAEPGRAFQD